MAENQLQGTNVEKDPEDWVTGDEPMTGAQASYLRTLSDQASEPFDERSLRRRPRAHRGAAGQDGPRRLAAVSA